MNKMYSLKQQLLLALVLTVTFTACSSVNNDVNSVLNSDVDMAANIVASSISDDESGLDIEHVRCILTSRWLWHLLF